MLHDGGLKAFTPGSVASAALESLAEDGDPNPLKGELNASPNATVEVVRIPDGAPAVAPILPGERFAFAITPTVDEPTFNLLSMVVQSNDTFLALGITGIELLDANGAPRSDGDIAMDIARQLTLYDAGTEGNQAGGAGPDQAPRQVDVNRGPPEGNGNVRKHGADVWSYPGVNELVKVTIIPE